MISLTNFFIYSTKILSDFIESIDYLIEDFIDDFEIIIEYDTQND